MINPLRDIKIRTEQHTGMKINILPLSSTSRKLKKKILIPNRRNKERNEKN